MLEPTTRPTGSKPAFSTHRYSFTDRSEVNSPRAFMRRRSLACSARPSVLVGSYVDTGWSPDAAVVEVVQVPRLIDMTGTPSGAGCGSWAPSRIAVPRTCMET